MPEPEKVIAWALAEFEWSGMPAADIAALPAYLMTHLRAAGIPLTDAERWAWVRERLLTDEAADAGWEGYADARDEGEDEPAVVMRRGLAAAIDHAAAADQGKEGTE